MFTGLIETTGQVERVEPTEGGTRITVLSPEGLVSRLRLGDSVAVSGVCLTALELQGTRFSADLTEETLRRTTLGRLEPGAAVNLELPTPAGAPLGGHVVQGHVDGVATLVAMEALHPEAPATTDWRLRLRLPAELARHVVQQGSITVEGISLTVALLRTVADGGAEVEIAIIPHTYQNTSLRTLRAGDAVNIETDVLARYAARGSEKTGEWLTVDYLLANGY